MPLATTDSRPLRSINTCGVAVSNRWNVCISMGHLASVGVGPGVDLILLVEAASHLVV